MALLDFKCEKCGSSFFEIINDEGTKISCPKCGSEEIKRIYKGKFYGKNGASCSGSCSGCSGCGH